MRNLARKIEPTGVFEDAGTVIRREEDGAFVVRTGSATLRAQRAVSCLVEPEVDDRVLCASVGRDACYVLAVLQRESGARTDLSVDGDLRVKLGAGRFEVAAQEGIDLVSGKDVAVVSGGVHMTAERGRFAIGQLAILGAAAVAHVETVKVVAGALDSVLERAVQKVKRSFRFVEESDQVKAESIDYRAQKTMSLAAENALVTAKELVKVDGSQVHIG